MAHSRFHDLNLSNATLIITDIVMLTGIYLFASHYLSGIYSLAQPSFDFQTLVYLFFFTLPIQLTLLAVGLYNEKLRENFRGITIRITVAIVLAYLLTFTLTLFIPFLALPGFTKEILYSTALVVLVIARYIAITNNYEQLGRRRVVLLGHGKRAQLINTSMRRKADRVHFELVGYIDIPGDQSVEPTSLPRITLTQPLEDYVRDEKIDEIVIAVDERRGTLPMDRLFKCKVQHILITDVIDFIERETGQIAVNHITPSFVIFNAHPSKSKFKAFLNWLFNSLIAMIILFVSWPLIIAAFIAIKIEDGIFSPVLYSQQRVGLQGRLFSIYKFRSMRIDAEKHGAQMAAKVDARVTKVGAILRKYRIDELPQLFNVLRGDMCFVGPRPERPQFSDQFAQDIPFYAHRNEVKPGLTGWAQLKYPYGDGLEDAIEKLKFDLYYIKHRSLRLDLLILIRTSEIVLFGKGR